MGSVSIWYRLYCHLGRGTLWVLGAVQVWVGREQIVWCCLLLTVLGIDNRGMGEPLGRVV